MASVARRRLGHRQPGRRILIFCEGERDEIYYLTTARSTFRIPATSIEIESCNGGSPQSIVDTALARRKKLERHPEVAYDEVWIVLDAEHVKTSGAKSAVEKARSEGLLIALSNPAFEIWFLLHASVCAQPLTAAQARRRVRETFGLKKRDRAIAFDDARLAAPWETAATNAQVRRRQIERDTQSPSSATATELVLLSNPATNVDDVIASLKRSKAGAVTRRT